MSPGFKPEGAGGDVFADAEEQISTLAVVRSSRGRSSPRPGIGGRAMTTPSPSAATVVAVGKKKPPPPPPVLRGSKPISTGVVGGGEVKCRECGCDEFRANVFKKGSCNNCFHVHIGV